MGHGNRWIAAGAAFALAVTGTVVVLRSGDSRPPQSMATTTTVDAGPRTTTSVRLPSSTSSSSSSSTSTTAEVEATSTTAAGERVLHKGSRGDEVVEIQKFLKSAHYDPGPADGAYGQATAYAVQAFQGLHGITKSGNWGPSERAVMRRASVNPTPLIPDGGDNRVEIDLRNQTLKLYRGGELELLSHVSTGSGKRYCVEGDCDNIAKTPAGTYKFTWRRKGWRESRLGKLYNPVYFNGGIAVHGAQSVPAYPASHGCVRIPMHIAEYFPSLVKTGYPVYVLDGRKTVRPAASTTTTVKQAPTTTTSTTSTTVPPSTTPTTSPPDTTPSTTTPSTTTPSSTTTTTTLLP